LVGPSERSNGPNLYEFVGNGPVLRIDPHGLFFPPWNTPPGYACDSYCTPCGGKCCNSALKAICNNAGTSPWDNCVRGCLLADWNSSTCSYNSGGFSIHAACFLLCGDNTDPPPDNPGNPIMPIF
jgi:hypothetical protein